MQSNTSPDLNQLFLTGPLLELPPNILTYRLTDCKHEIKHTMDATLDKTLDKTGQTFFLNLVTNQSTTNLSTPIFHRLIYMF